MVRGARRAGAGTANAAVTAVAQPAAWVAASASLARAQRSLVDPSFSYDLFPPLTAGCPRSNTAAMQYPLDIDYAYEAVDLGLFDRPRQGLTHWQQLLPPLRPGLSMGEGGTPLIEAPVLATWAGAVTPVYLKDESRNPTWSHKDRLNLCAVSAAAAIEAPGIAVASSGNHGASAAAYAARAGLPCVVITSHGIGATFRAMMQAYGAAIVAVDSASRWPVLRRLIERTGFHPVSNLTMYHTGHPFGAEGYKTVAYEIYLDLGRALPGTVVVPTGAGELLYGTYKGFVELMKLGLSDRLPHLVAVEPAARAPLMRAVEWGEPAAEVAPGPTIASGIASTVSGYRGVVALRDSGGRAMAVTDDELLAAAEQLGRWGTWQEPSGAAGLAALRQSASRGEPFEGPVVIIATSGGFKEPPADPAVVPDLAPEWPEVERYLEGFPLIRAALRAGV